MTPITRRDLLKIISQGMIGVCGVLGIIGLIRYLGFEPDPPPPQRFEVGKTDDYLIDTRSILKNIPAVLIHNSKGFKAISLTCQHLGCTVDAKADGFVCPCHGSRYSADGKILKGPAERDLRQLKVEITTDNNIIIFKG